MVPSVADVIGRFKSDWSQQIESAAIQEACRDLGYEWRDRLLNPATTIQLFILQVLNGNTACTHLPHLSGLRFAAAAYCQARNRLPLKLFQTLLERVVTCLKHCVSGDGRWKGHRVFFVDGSGVSMPDTPELLLEFGQPSQQQPGCGFPVAHLLCLTHAGTGLITKTLSGPLVTHDIARTLEIHPEMKQGDVLVADRGFCSYAHLVLLMQAGIHAVFRVGGRRKIDFTPNRPFVFSSTRREPRFKGMPRSRHIKKLGESDQLVDWFKTRTVPPWLDSSKYESMPDTIRVMELQYRIGCPGFRTQEVTLVTTLLDSERYSLEDIAMLYGKRWEIETGFAHVKTTMKMDMLQSSKLQQVDVERISFVDALRWHCIGQLLGRYRIPRRESSSAKSFRTSGEKKGGQSKQQSW